MEDASRADAAGADAAGMLDARVPSAAMRDSWRLSGLLDAEAVVTELLSRYPPSTELYVVDQAFDQLVRILHDGSGGDVVPLRGGLRAAVLRVEPFHDDSGSWYPVPERDNAVFVLRFDEPPGEPPPVDRSVGTTLRDQRSRFEDLERIRRRRPMTVEAELQWGLLPAQADVLGDYGVCGVLEPAYEVAGDVFDYASSSGAFWAYSFDGMGHGLDATLMSVLVLAAIRNMRRSGASLVEQMQRANEVLHDAYGGDRFVTGVGVRITSDSCEFVNAGHEPVRLVVGGEVRELELEPGLPLGVVAEPHYETQQIGPLEPGDGLIMLSDGSAGATATNGSEFGADRLNVALADHWSDIPFETAQNVIEAVLGHIGDADVGDDITLVVVRRQSAGGDRSTSVSQPTDTPERATS